jgi:glutathione S-transferase
MGMTIWESLAILDHVARKHPQSGLWPEDHGVSQPGNGDEFGDGVIFHGLRSACPMNMRRERKPIEVTPAICQRCKPHPVSVELCLEKSGGPFLFGAFSIADAMFAPVVNRLDVYAFETMPEVRAYMAR